MRNQELLMREPALALVMGALPEQRSFDHSSASASGSNVGFGDDYGYGFSAFDPSMNLGVGWHRGYEQHSLRPFEPHRYYHHPYAPPPQPYVDEDADYGYGYGFGAPPPPPPPPSHAMAPHPAAPHPAVHQGMHQGMHHGHHMARHWEMQNPSSTMSRTLLLDPNRDSIVKVERYSFSFSPTPNLVLGTASNITPFTQQPSTSIKGQRVIMNAPVPGFVLVSSLQIANVNVLVGGTEDAFTYSAGAQGVMLDLPRLDPQNRATSAGAYTGVLPSGYTQGNSFQFIITLQGPSTLAGGYGQ
jgi:hypothetical protein